MKDSQYLYTNNKTQNKKEVWFFAHLFEGIKGEQIIKAILISNAAIMKRKKPENLTRLTVSM